MTLLRTRSFPGLRVHETCYEPGFRLKRHHHEPLTISFVFYGGYLEAQARHESWVQRDCLLYKPAGMAHANCFGKEGAWGLLVEIEEEWTKQWEAFAPRDPIHRVDPSILPLGLELRRCAQTGPSLAVHALVVELLGCLRDERPATRRPAWLARVDQRLREEPGERLSLDELARGAGVHPVHLAQSWRKWCGTTLGARRRALRFSRAALELTLRDARLAEVAARCGYADQSHLTRDFRRTASISPARFRARHGTAP